MICRHHTNPALWLERNEKSETLPAYYFKSKTATGNYYGIYKDNQWLLLVSECK
jgi:hypothetical protein